MARSASTVISTSSTGSKDDALDQEFVNALTTNLTRFFREDHHFDHLAEHVAQLIATKPRVNPNGQAASQDLVGRLLDRAGALYHRAAPFEQVPPSSSAGTSAILATDIDTAVLAKAASGAYPEGELAGLSRERAALFDRPGDGTIRIPASAREI